jgi:hypothetical protein
MAKVTAAVPIGAYVALNCSMTDLFGILQSMTPFILISSFRMLCYTSAEKRQNTGSRLVVMKYQPVGKRNLGRPINRLLNRNTETGTDHEVYVLETVMSMMAMTTTTRKQGCRSFPKTLGTTSKFLAPEGLT